MATTTVSPSPNGDRACTCNRKWESLYVVVVVVMQRKLSKIKGKLSKIRGKLSKIRRKMSKIENQGQEDVERHGEEDVENQGQEDVERHDGETRTTTTTTTTTLLLPQHIIIEILSWVPAKSIVNSFKLVCKEWRALILDPHFVKMHLNRGGAGGGLLCKSGNVLFQLHPPFNFEVRLPPTPIAATKLVDDFGLSFRFLGSCNGLICLSIQHDQIVIILNLSTRKIKISPKKPIQPLPKLHKIHDGPVTFGFGCCCDSDEYKVVSIACFDFRRKGKDCILAQYEIYSMRLNSWRRDSRQGFRDSYVSFGELGVFSNGALHWMSGSIRRRSKGWDRIVSFDIRDEEFRQVPIPVSFELPTAQMQDIILMNMRGCLTMVRFSDVNNNTMGANLEVWVMKEYGMKESWTEEFVIRSSDSDPPRALYGFSLSSSANAYALKNDQIITEASPLEERYRKMLLYGINKGKIDGNFKMIGVRDDANMVQVDYIETLVSLKSSLLPLSNN